MQANVLLRFTDTIFASSILETRGRGIFDVVTIFSH